MQAIATRGSFRWLPVWIVAYALLIAITGFILYSAVDTAPVIWEAEARNGQPLTCNQAYDQREIDAALYADHRTRADALYLFNLCSPVWLLAFGAVTFALARYRTLSGRLRWMIIGITVALATAVILYMPVVHLVACATE